jgi:hypothetical protein
MVTLTTGIIFPIHLHAFWVCGEFYEGGPALVRQPPIKWSTTAESVIKTGLEHVAWTIYGVYYSANASNSRLLRFV